MSLAHCAWKILKQCQLINRKNTKKKSAKKKKNYYIVDLKCFPNADGDEGLGAETLHGEWDARCNVSNRPKWFENSHSSFVSVDLWFRPRVRVLKRKLVEVLGF